MDEKLKYARTCFKVRYSSRKRAKDALKKINKTMTAAIKAKTFDKLMDVYFCEECRIWHTTSMSKLQSRRFEAYKKIKTKQ